MRGRVVRRWCRRRREHRTRGKGRFKGRRGQKRRGGAIWRPWCHRCTSVWRVCTLLLSFAGTRDVIIRTCNSVEHTRVTRRYARRKRRSAIRHFFSRGSVYCPDPMRNLYLRWLFCGKKKIYVKNDCYFKLSSISFHWEFVNLIFYKKKSLFVVGEMCFDIIL